MHNREKIYGLLWEETDRMGMLKMNQQEMAAKIGIPYQRLSLIYSEFQQRGLMRKYRHKFQLMKAPEEISW
jgi:CRP-like cAMP-binding protein